MVDILAECLESIWRVQLIKSNYIPSDTGKLNGIFVGI
jgi:hypothetical protein